MQYDRNYTFAVAEKLLSIDSPSGYTADVMAYVAEEASRLGYAFTQDVKGNGIIDVPGKSDKLIGVSGHIDTLGLMVRAIKASGTLAITRIGGPILPTLDGEYCRIRTRDGQVFGGTILCTSPAAHVFPDAATLERKEATLEVRIDEPVKSKEDVQALGIMAGDYVCIDPKTVVTASGFIKSRFLDDKLSVALMFGALKALRDAGKTPAHQVKMILSTYEEVGHGMAHIPAGITELLSVDMGCIGDDLVCTEYDVSICAKDSSGPYDYALTSKLIGLAKRDGLQFAVDIYPFYSSDVSASRSAGNDIRGALIGAGVHASHGMERAHWEGMQNTMKLLGAYLLEA